MLAIPPIQQNDGSRWGFPGPGTQQPRPDDVVTNAMFVSSGELDQLVSFDDYDIVVVGSGCTALAFIDEALKLNPHKKILCLERGGFLLPTHFQNLSASFKNLIGGESETYPWTLSERTFQSVLGYCHGYYPFFGGRSLFWSGWCPQPPIESLRGYPESMLQAAAQPEFWSRAREVLNVNSTEDIEDRAFQQLLQRQMSSRLKLPIGDIPSLAESQPAMLAGGHRSKQANIGFSKFCAAESLLSLVHQQAHKALRGKGSPLHIGLSCTVEKVLMDGESVTGIETSRGVFKLNGNRTKLVLCAGAVPNTTLLYNSIPRIRETAGKRLTGHFLSHVTMRIPKVTSDYWSESQGDSLEIAAQCLLGYHPSTKRQYQIQVTAVHSPDPERDIEELARKCPDYSASAQPNQLRGSEGHVLFMCAAIGEFSEQNEQCWLRPDDNNPDKTTNIRLQYLCNEEDEELWSFMESVTFQLANRLSRSASRQYWNKFTQSWSAEQPSQQQMRIRGVVHEASSTFVGPEYEGGSLDESYRPYGCNDVYVTGAGIFPTAGAWNPTLPMCAFAQDLARKLELES